jgi:EAL and modified HD-GYP domain-containing signal transduction protein
MEIYVARQPIFDKKRKVFAYELLFRHSMENFMPKIDGDCATSSVLSSSFLNLGLDSLTGGRNVFINFTKNLILERIPMMFPTKDTVVEILENIEPTEDVLEALCFLKKKGYRLALDDYVFDSAHNAFIELADIVKVDFMGIPLGEIREKISGIPKKTVLLAEKIETWEEFRAAIDMGFTLFQGYFFCKPEIVKGREVPASSMALLEIMKEVNNRDLDFSKVTEKISRDVSISYKLLRYINSAFFKRVNEITSIKSALVFLGQDELRRFMSVILMANLASSSIPELAIASCVRGRFCERLGELSMAGKGAQELFTLGLFSLIDAILDQPMEKIMEKLPLSDTIREALINQRGGFSDYLKLVICFEKGDWKRMDSQARSIKVDVTVLPQVYKESIEWADELKKLDRKSVV